MFPFAQSTIASIALWLLFVATVYCVARYGPWWCIPSGHLAVAVIIYQMHFAWIRHEMSRPGWDGEPDMDIIFAIGLSTQVGLVWMVLLPVTAIGVWLKRRHARQRSHSDKPVLEIEFL